MSINRDNSLGSMWIDLVSGITSAIATVFVSAIAEYLSNNFQKDPRLLLIVQLATYSVAGVFGIFAILSFGIAMWELFDSAWVRTTFRQALKALWRRIKKGIEDGTVTHGELQQLLGTPGAIPQLSSGNLVDTDLASGGRGRQIRNGFRRRVRIFSFVSPIVVIIGFASIFTGGRFPSIPPVNSWWPFAATHHAKPTPAPTSIPFTVFPVSANQGWQDTHVAVKNGEIVTITYESGMWDAWPGKYPRSDANGPEGVYTLCYCGEPLPGYSTQGLIGRIGSSGAPFFVGDFKTLTTQSSGDLALRINDKDNRLFDNTGTVTVKVIVLNATH